MSNTKEKNTTIPISVLTRRLSKDYERIILRDSLRGFDPKFLSSKNIVYINKMNGYKKFVNALRSLKRKISKLLKKIFLNKI
jgi:hypothetical protein